MNLPNKLTLLRVFMVPVFVILMYIGKGALAFDIAALAVFVAASITDMLDGMIARKYNLITNFGKFMDPLADKLLVCSALICLVEMGRMPGWICIIIICREFIISGFRLIASDNGVVIAANIWGKLKTVFSMVFIMLKVLYIDNTAYRIFGDVVMWIALVLTIISLITYVVENRKVLGGKK